MTAAWKPSRLAAPTLVDPLESARMRQSDERSLARSSVGGIDRIAAGFTTDAEHPYAVTPFLAEAMRRDYRNRHLQEREYLVLPGGDTVYHSGEKAPREERKFPTPPPPRSTGTGLARLGRPPAPYMPTPQEIFGHQTKGSR